MIKKYFFIITCLFLSISSYAQSQKDNDSSLIQFSGVILDGDSLVPVPFAAVIVKDTYRGTTSDFYGYFSFVATKGDTIEFSSIGYGDETFVIPDTLTSNRYSLIQLMNSDTVVLKEFQVYPWPSKEQFREAFINLNVDRDDYDRALANLSPAEMRRLAIETPAASGSANFKYTQTNRNSQLYYAGQYPSNTLLNPIAWAQFIDAWKRGDFSNKK